MNVLTITVNEKRYSAGRFPAYLALEIMRLSQNIAETAKKRKEAMEATRKAEDLLKKLGKAKTDEERDAIVQELSAVHIDENIVDELSNVSQDEWNRKAWIICEAYGNRFSNDELLKSLSLAEINAEIRKITDAVNGVFEKN